MRWLYLTILTTHTLLAAVIVPLVIITLSRGLRARFLWMDSRISLIIRTTSGASPAGGAVSLMTR